MTRPAVSVGLFAVLCSASAARADDGSEHAWIAEASVGAGLTQDLSPHRLGRGDVSVGALITRKLGVSARLSAVAGDANYLATLGPQVHLWLTDQLWVASSAALIVAPGNGATLGGRVGVAFSQYGFSPSISAELTATSRGLVAHDEAGFEPALLFSLNVGVQMMPDAPPGTASSDPGRQRRQLGTALITAGAIVDLAALFVGAKVMDLRDRAEFGCNDDLSRCSTEGLFWAEPAYTYSKVSTAMFIAGTAAVGAGIYFRYTAPQRVSMALAPSVGAQGAGAVLDGRF